jgi:CMP-N-acetylneuraminic acid synthetase
MRRLALVPARGGSKGIPRKNIALLGGKPLIAWTIQAARSASSIDRVVVSTDDAEIAEIAVHYGAEVPFLRPADLSGDRAAAQPVIAHAVSWLAVHEGWTAEAVAYLQPTSPLRGAADIDHAAELLTTRNADTVVSVVPVPHNMTPASLMRECEGLLEFCMAEDQRQFSRHDKPRLYARNGPAILLARRAVIEAGTLYGARIVG